MKEEKAVRTREEINRRISELRNEWDIAPRADGTGHPGKEWDWHADANWPTLLREMPAGLVRYDPEERVWTACHNYSLLEQDLYERAAAEAERCGAAVCLAWLNWKESQ